METMKTYIISGIGMLVLFAAFVLYGTNANPSLGFMQLTDALTLIGGLLFIIPIYRESLIRKTRDHAPNQWAWTWLPIIGMALFCVGVIMPDSFADWGLLTLPDIMYLLGCLFMLVIFVYPATLNREMLEDDTDAIVDEEFNNNERAKRMLDEQQH